jgi:hypothetical protein
MRTMSRRTLPENTKHVSGKNWIFDLNVASACSALL